jgi:hypothetical protein
MSQAKSKKEENNSATVSATTSGMDDFFNPLVTNETNVALKTGKKAKADSAEILTVKQACQKLGIRKRTLYARISDGTYKTYAGRDNKIRIIFTAEGPKVASHAARIVQAVSTASPVEPAQTIHTAPKRDINNVTSQNLLDLIERLTHQLSSASTRIGYLEAQVTNYQEQVKLLPDLTERAAQTLSLKEENDELRKKFAALELELTQVRKPWWKKVFAVS